MNRHITKREEAMLDKSRREPTEREEVEVAWRRYMELLINRCRMVESLRNLDQSDAEYNVAQGSNFNLNGWGK